MNWSSIPAIHYAAALSAAAPLVAQVTGGRRSAVGRWIVIVCGLSLLTDAISLRYALLGMNNHWVSYTLAPLYSASVVMVLAHGQPSRTGRQAFIIAAVLLLLVTFTLALTVEDPTRYSRFAAPLRTLTILALATWTLVRHEPVPGAPGGLRSGWFWIPLGFALYSGASAAYFPVAWGFAELDREAVLAIGKLRAMVVILSFLVVAWGVRCLSRHPNSGLRSSRSSSPLPSS